MPVTVEGVDEALGAMATSSLSQVCGARSELEVVTTEDKSISALLGASPGASVCVNIVLEVVQKCFPGLSKKEEAKKKLKEMIPSYDMRLLEMTKPDEVKQYRNWSETAEINLGLGK